MKQEKFLRVAVAAARESGRIQMKSLGRVKKIRFKGEINLVTEIDKRCERAIIQKIRRYFPDHELLTEESGMLKKDSDYRWIIDPLDGTTNYSHGYPLFCTSIALEYRGEVLVGVVYEPNLDQLFTGVKGVGSWLNGRRIHVSKTSRFIRAFLSTGFPYNVHRTADNNLNHFRNFIRRCQAVRRDGVAAVDLCYVACGRYDGFWESGLWAWDVAAAKVILEEAGGKLSQYDGGPFTIYGKEIIASHGKIHRQMVRVIQYGRKDSR